MFQDILLVVVLLLIFGSAVWVVRKSRKSGKKCIGCPESGGCSGACGCNKPQ